MGGLPSTSVITAPRSILRRVKIAAGLGQPARPAPAPARRQRQPAAQRPHRHRRGFGPQRHWLRFSLGGHCSSTTTTAAALRPIIIIITTVAPASLSRPYRARGSTACLKSRATSAQLHPDGRFSSAFRSDAPSDPIHPGLLRNRALGPYFPNCLASADEDQPAGLPATRSIGDASFASLHPDPGLAPEPLELRPGSSRPRAASTAASAASRKRLRTLASHLRHCHRPP